MRAVVITVSDRVSTGEAQDISGPAAATFLDSLGFESEVRVVPDGIESVEGALQSAISDDTALVVTTGGTGMSPRDLTPEATRRVLSREAPGLAEAMRSATFGRNPHGMLSRAVSGVAGTTLVINLPGSVSGVEESLTVIGPALRHAVELIRGEPTEH
ncbi:MAG TPA: MogA/MoaB family molybdenum cofactor biosynthesis protein [Acidimicrobiia bacterium]|nr:MogA/MoaB family molybdenum cofactor biosynthesis protein [Acidimicrobiia bacterium]